MEYPFLVLQDSESNYSEIKKGVNVSYLDMQYSKWVNL